MFWSYDYQHVHPNGKSPRRGERLTLCLLVTTQEDQPRSYMRQPCLVMRHTHTHGGSVANVSMTNSPRSTTSATYCIFTTHHGTSTNAHGGWAPGHVGSYNKIMLHFNVYGPGRENTWLRLYGALAASRRTAPVRRRFVREVPRLRRARHPRRLASQTRARCHHTVSRVLQCHHSRSTSCRRSNIGHRLAATSERTRANARLLVQVCCHTTRHAVPEYIRTSAAA